MKPTLIHSLSNTIVFGEILPPSCGYPGDHAQERFLHKSMQPSLEITPRVTQRPCSLKVRQRRNSPPSACSRVPTGPAVRCMRNPKRGIKKSASSAGIPNSTCGGSCSLQDRRPCVFCSLLTPVCPVTPYSSPPAGALLPTARWPWRCAPRQGRLLPRPGVADPRHRIQEAGSWRSRPPSTAVSDLGHRAKITATPGARRPFRQAEGSCPQR